MAACAENLLLDLRKQQTQEFCSSANPRVSSADKEGWDGVEALFPLQQNTGLEAVAWHRTGVPDHP